MSAQFIFSPQNFEAVAKAAGLTKTVSFNRVMLEHYTELYRRCNHGWIDPRRLVLRARMEMYRHALDVAIVQEFINDVNAQQNGPAIRLSD